MQASRDVKKLIRHLFHKNVKAHLGSTSTFKSTAPCIPFRDRVEKCYNIAHSDILQSHYLPGGAVRGGYVECSIGITRVVRYDMISVKLHDVESGDGHTKYEVSI
jgi:hypothetical protein